MKYLFENLEVATQVELIISANMGYTLPNRFDIPRLINNPEHADYNKAFLSEVEGDEQHHALWMVGVDGVIPYDVVEYDSNWFLPEE